MASDADWFRPHSVQKCLVANGNSKKNKNKNYLRLLKYYTDKITWQLCDFYFHSWLKIKNINVIGNVTENEVNGRSLFSQCIYDSKMFFEHIGHNICPTKLQKKGP